MSAEETIRVGHVCPHCEKDMVWSITPAEAIDHANVLLAAAGPLMPLERPVRVRGGCDA